MSELYYNIINTKAIHWSLWAMSKWAIKIQVFKNKISFAFGNFCPQCIVHPTILFTLIEVVETPSDWGPGPDFEKPGFGFWSKKFKKYATRVPSFWGWKNPTHSNGKTRVLNQVKYPGPITRNTLYVLVCMSYGLFAIFMNNEDFSPYLSAVFENCYLIPRIFFQTIETFLQPAANMYIIAAYLVKLWNLGILLEGGSFTKNFKDQIAQSSKNGKIVHIIGVVSASRTTSFKKSMRQSINCDLL